MTSYWFIFSDLFCFIFHWMLWAYPRMGTRDRTFELLLELRSPNLWIDLSSSALPNGRDTWTTACLILNRGICRMSPFSNLQILLCFWPLYKYPWVKKGVFFILIIEGGNAQVAEEFTRISCVFPVHFSASMWWKIGQILFFVAGTWSEKVKKQSNGLKC